MKLLNENRVGLAQYGELFLRHFAQAPHGQPRPRERVTPDHVLRQTQIEPEPPDFVIASGIMAVAVPDYEAYVLRVLRRLHALGRRGFGCNFLSTCTQRPDGVSRYVEPAWLLSLFQRHIHWRCRLIHDYRPNDFTLIHTRD